MEGSRNGSQPDSAFLPELIKFTQPFQIFNDVNLHYTIVACLHLNETQNIKS